LEVAGARDARELSFTRKILIGGSIQDSFGVLHVLMDLINVPTSTFSLERVTFCVVGILLLTRLFATHSERENDNRREKRRLKLRSAASQTDKHTY
jgi:hypothetical protein